MARSLRFLIDGGEYETAPVKVDRRKLYGWSETVALDEGGRECKLISITPLILHLTNAELKALPAESVV